MPLGNPLQLGLNDNTHALKIKGTLLLTDPWAVQRAEQQRWHSFVQILGTTAAVPLWSRLALFNSQLGCPTFFLWLISVGCFQHLWCKDGYTIWKSWAKAGLPRGTPYLSFSELDSTCLPITAYTVEPVLHGRVRSLMSDNMKVHEGKCVAYESCFIFGENDWSKYSKNL